MACVFIFRLLLRRKKDIDNRYLIILLLKSISNGVKIW